ELALAGVPSEGEEVEGVGIFDELLGEIGLRLWEGRLEVGDGAALTAVQSALDLHYEDIATPAVLDGLLSIPEPLRRVLHLVQQHTIVGPRQLCSRLLQYWLVRPGVRETLHIHEV